MIYRVYSNGAIRYLGRDIESAWYYFHTLPNTRIICDL